jgi:glycosyltransferase involved in cell wall biosynthesis
MTIDPDRAPDAGRIAVVIPCYNDGATLEDAVESALAQDVPLEVLVVDDGSTDRATGAALARVAARGARVLRQENQGPAAARTAGLRAARAEYAFPLDADDVLAPGGLRLLRDALERHPRAVASWGSVRHFGGVEFVQPSLPSLDPWQLSYQNHLPLGALYRREVVLSVGGWCSVSAYEDWDLWMTLAERGWTGVGVPAVTVHYRVHSGRRVSDALARHAEQCAQLRARHPDLYAARRYHRRASPAPPLLKLALPAIDALPLDPTAKRLLGGAATYVASGSGWSALLARVRVDRIRRVA